MEFTQAQVDAHNALTAAGAAIVKTYALMDGRSGGRSPDLAARREIGKGIRLYVEALTINPEGWSSMWALGKLYQSLGDNASALRWFAEAHRIKPDQPDVLREAGLAALSVGAKEEAVKLCLAAVQLAPDDLGLQSNLALAYLIAGDDEHAEECAKVAASSVPRDGTSRAVLTLVQNVRHGKRPRPARIGEETS